jgi:hypothetical protein
MAEASSLPLHDLMIVSILTSGRNNQLASDSSLVIFPASSRTPRSSKVNALQRHVNEGILVHSLI